MCLWCPAGVLGEPASDQFDRLLLDDEPLERVRKVLQEAQHIHGL